MSMFSLAKHITSSKLYVNMSDTIFKQAIIELVVKNNVPLMFFMSNGFKNLCGEMSDKLKVSLDRHSVRKYVIEKYQKEKNILKEQLKDKLIYVKMDGCTRHRTNYLGINIRYLDINHEPVTKNLAIKNTKAKHCSIDLKNILLSVLDDYDIKISQVLSIITDNASNMLAVSKILQEEIQDDIESYSEKNNNDEYLNENMIDFDIFNTDVEEKFLLTHMRCAAHTFQLAIRD